MPALLTIVSIVHGIVQAQDSFNRFILSAWNTFSSVIRVFVLLKPDSHELQSCEIFTSLNQQSASPYICNFVYKCKEKKLLILESDTSKKLHASAISLWQDKLIFAVKAVDAKTFKSTFGEIVQRHNLRWWIPFWYGFSTILQKPVCYTSIRSFSLGRRSVIATVIDIRFTRQDALFPDAKYPRSTCSKHEELDPAITLIAMEICSARIDISYNPFRGSDDDFR